MSACKSLFLRIVVKFPRLLRFVFLDHYVSWRKNQLVTIYNLNDVILILTLRQPKRWVSSFCNYTQQEFVIEGFIMLILKYR